MANLEGALEQLREERKRAEEQAEQLGSAILAIEGILGRSSGSRNGRQPGRVVSAAARRRMAQAQKARWARVRQGSSSTATAGPRIAGKRRTLSVAARRKIAAAQRARWARFRAKQERVAA